MNFCGSMHTGAVIRKDDSNNVSGRVQLAKSCLLLVVVYSVDKYIDNVSCQNIISTTSCNADVVNGPCFVL
jgi:hypothetical protein